MSQESAVYKSTLVIEEWPRIGAIAGLASMAAFVTVMFVHLPDALRMWIFFLIPLGGILFVIGLDRMIRSRRPTVVLDIATLFGVIGLSVMNLMAVVQYVIDIQMGENMPVGKDQSTREMVEWVARAVNSVQLGMGKSFDLFILLSLFLFGIAMMSHPKFGLGFGIPTCVIGAAELALNVRAFPLPPQPDLEVFVAVWFFVVALRMLWSYRPEPAQRE